MRELAGHRRRYSSAIMESCSLDVGDAVISTPQVPPFTCCVWLPLRHSAIGLVAFSGRSVHWAGFSSLEDDQNQSTGLILTCMSVRSPVSGGVAGEAGGSVWILTREVGEGAGGGDGVGREAGKPPPCCDYAWLWQMKFRLCPFSLRVGQWAGRIGGRAGDCSGRGVPCVVAPTGECG